MDQLSQYLMPQLMRRLGFDENAVASSGGWGQWSALLNALTPMVDQVSASANLQPNYDGDSGSFQGYDSGAIGGLLANLTSMAQANPQISPLLQNAPTQNYQRTRTPGGGVNGGPLVGPGPASPPNVIGNLTGGGGALTAGNSLHSGNILPQEANAGSTAISGDGNSGGGQTVEDPNVTVPTMIGGVLHVPAGGTPTGPVTGQGGGAYGAGPSANPAPLPPSAPPATPQAAQNQPTNGNIQDMLTNWKNYSIAQLKAGLSPAQQLTLPREALSQFSNQDLIALGNQTGNLQSFLAGFSNDRLATFDLAILAKLPADRISQFDQGMQDKIKTAQQSPQNPGTPIGGGPVNNPGAAAPGAVYNPSLRGGSAQEDIAQGLQGVSGLADADIERLFPFATDPGSASRNLVRGVGLDTSAGNPFVDFLTNRLPQQLDLWRTRNVLAGKPASAEQTMTDLSGGGLNSLFGGSQQGGDFTSSLRNLQSNYQNNPNTLSLEQQGLAERLKDPNEAFGLYASGQNLSPDFASGGVLNKVNQNLLDRYKNQAAGKPGKTYLDFISGNF